ncbi:phosphonate ABC transporter ATP-binding protein [Janthinobacterium psychrotolerans]|uniref:Phosphonate transport system ATP-binding protein n=1 Tax=Janthinobacterium psychrotolerans TaxID=1747903 RepID=A0A1A7BYY5_9BURK|nr:ATP-binding cassette domain-containing protein [Janthinobacterium psychrotolerans]OBV38727.1 phosphonate transport system ATP-binding protein [Janthinobacterium psychrotolerans]
MTFQLHKVSVHHAGAAGNALALHELSLDVAQGEQIALIGPSGAGKTSLLHTLACALRPASGSLTILGKSPWQLASRERHALRARLFLAPQTPPLPPRQRVVNAVLAGRLPQWTLWTAIRSLVAPTHPRAAWEALGRFNLQDKLYARVDRLSGGERQRCGMARALVSNAQVFLVDEPLSALDPTLAVQTIAVLQEEATARKATLICSLHQVEIARACFPRMIGLRDGQVVFDAPATQVTDAMIAALYKNKADPAPGFDSAPEQLEPARPHC